MIDDAEPIFSLSSFTCACFWSLESAMVNNEYRKKKGLHPGDQRGRRHDALSVSRVSDAVYLGGAYLRPSA